MPNYTENYNLIKPLPKDQYDIQHFNDNMDTLDGTLKSHQDQITLTKEETTSALTTMQESINTVEQNTSEEALKNKIDEALLDSLDEKIATEVSSEIDVRSLISQETFNPLQEKVLTLETNFSQTSETVTSLSNDMTNAQESITAINEIDTTQNQKISNLEADIKTLDPEAIREMKEMQNDLNAKMYAYPGLVLQFHYFNEIKVTITIQADQPLFLVWGDGSSVETIMPNTKISLDYTFSDWFHYCIIYSIYDFNLTSFSCLAKPLYDGEENNYSEIWICDKILSLPRSFLYQSAFEKVYFISKKLTSLPDNCLRGASSSYVYLADNISQFGYDSLSHMSKLTTITLPESLINYNDNFLRYNYSLTSVYFRQPAFITTNNSQALCRGSSNITYYSTYIATLKANVNKAKNSYFSYDRTKITYQQLETITNTPDKDILNYIPKQLDTYLELLRPSGKTIELEGQINTLNSDINTLNTEVSSLKDKDSNLQQQLDYLFIVMFPTFASRFSFKYSTSSSTLGIPQLSQDEQYGIIKYNEIYSGSTLLNKYITSPILTSSSGNIAIASSYLDLIDERFKNNTYITSIDLSKAVFNTFGEGVFSGCTSLISVIWSEDLDNIPNYTFSNCTILQQIDFPETLKTIGEKAFLNDTHLQNQIDLTNCRGLRTIGAGAFNGCSSLSELKLPYTTFSIQENAFANCGRLDLYFDGPASDWSAMVSLATDWNKNSSITVFDASGKIIELE